MLRSTGFASEDFKRLRDETISGKSFKDALGEELGPIAEASFRGPWLALIGDDGQPQPLFPCPSTLLKVEADDGVHEQILRLDPLRENAHLPGWSDANGMRPLWSRSKERGKQAGGFITIEGLFAFLRCEEVKPEHIKSASELFDWDDRTGIAINPDARSVEESKIYAIRLLSLRNDSGAKVVLYAEIDGSDALQNYLPKGVDTMPFGGEGRSVAIKPLESPVPFPEVEGTGDGTLLLMTSSAPTSPESPTIPDALDPDNIVAMSVPGSIAVSGWDLARGGPKRTRFGVPAGSVYFLKKSIRDQRDSVCNDEDAQLGWGTFVEGSWSYA
jgi:CRISPR-associated protein Cmr3